MSGARRVPEQRDRSDEPSADMVAEPLLRVVNADATPEEIAALVAVFSALGSAPEDAPRRPRPAWSNPARGLRRTHRPGDGAWRASGLPR